MKKTLAMLVVSVASFGGSAAADSDLYLNAGLGVFDGDGATLKALTARGGIAIYDLLSAELEASFGLGAEQVDGAPGAELKLENQFGGYLARRYPVLPNLEVIGRIGYTTGEFQASAGGVAGDVETDGVAFGIGGEYMITPQFGLRGDYTRIDVDDDALDGGVNTFALAAVYRVGSLR
jgi:hypothetical protein